MNFTLPGYNVIEASKTFSAWHLNFLQGIALNDIPGIRHLHCLLRVRITSSSGGDDAGSNLQNEVFSVCPAENRLSRAPPDLPRPHDSITATPHGSPRRPRRQNGRRRPTRGAGTIGRRPPGNGLLHLRDEGEGSPGSEGFPIFKEVVPLTGIVFSPSVWVSLCMEAVVFRDGMLSSPLGIIYPYFGSEIERSTMYAQNRGSSPTFCFFCFGWLEGWNCFLKGNGWFLLVFVALFL